MTTPTFSFEFFPPKSEETAEKLQQTWNSLLPLGPKFCSVTFGAGGSTQQGTYETIKQLLRRSMDAAPHLSCIGSTKNNIREILQRYRSEGVRRIVALRGDMPSGMQEAGEFRHANELVAFIRSETGAHFHVEVAAYPEVHPQASNAQVDLKNFKRKVDAGANAAITQYFFNADAYAAFVEACTKLGITIPIVPGIMPITNYSQLARFSDACGAEIPRWVRKRLESYGDDRGSIKAFGLEVVTHLCERLLADGAPGLHFYTMNQAEATTALWRNLKLDAKK